MPIQARRRARDDDRHFFVRLAPRPEELGGRVAADKQGETRLGGKGGYSVTLPCAMLDRLKSLRGPGQNYSDVILRLATAN
jgi:hypothetical protein